VFDLWLQGGGQGVRESAHILTTNPRAAACFADPSFWRSGAKRGHERWA